MKNKILFVLFVIALFSFDLNLVRAETCSKNGYTVLTINGIFTNKSQAVFNKKSLEYKLSSLKLSEPITVDYIYNPTHAGGIGDLVDVARQGLFDPKSDYDLVEMMDDASGKISTQKVLLVGHSQGNFYANNFYDKVADVQGGIPSKSIGVYGVASPDKRVAGDGKYITSDTDKVIAVIVGRLKNILEPNTHIELSKDDDSNGHSFSDVYLKYRSKEIVADIKSSLDKLESNDIQDSNSRCISPQKVSVLHSIAGLALGALDFSAQQSVLAYNASSYPLKALTTIFGKLFHSSLALVDGADDSSTNTDIEDSINTEKAISDTSKNSSNELTTINNISQSEGIEAPIQSPVENTINVNTKTEEPSQQILHSGGHLSSGSNVDDTTNSDNTTETNTNNNDTTPDTTAPIITLNGDENIYLKLNDAYVENGAIAKDDRDTDVSVVISGVVDTTKIGEYILTYTATDKSGNISIKNRNVKVVSYIYIPKNTFGSNNGDGNNWQAWSFNGSNIFDWTDTYVGGYLHERFKIQAYGGGYYCGQCLQRGVFNHDPQKGFEPGDVKLSNLEANPQNNENDTVYLVSIQWDNTGYSYEISHDDAVDYSGHTDVSDITNDTWVGWDGSYNNFKEFPSGNWANVVPFSINGMTGGSDMILQPYPVYNLSAEQETKPEPSTPSTPTLSSQKEILSFDFKNLNPEVVGVIGDGGMIGATVPYGTDITNLIPIISISDKATVSPASLMATDFSSPVNYTVTAQDGTTKVYVVTVNILPKSQPDPTPAPVPTEDPKISSYTLNNVQGDVGLNPLETPLNISLIANKNVNWMSMKIENYDDPGVYKIFYSDAKSCIDETSTCAKVWDGSLSGQNTLLKNGMYKIKIHIKDDNNKEWFDYLPSTITVNGQL